jgi:hypothetical protein
MIRVLLMEIRENDVKRGSGYARSMRLQCSRLGVGYDDRGICGFSWDSEALQSAGRNIRFWNDSIATVGIEIWC